VVFSLALYHLFFHCPSPRYHWILNNIGDPLFSGCVLHTGSSRGHSISKAPSFYRPFCLCACSESCRSSLSPFPCVGAHGTHLLVTKTLAFLSESGRAEFQRQIAFFSLLRYRLSLITIFSGFLYPPSYVRAKFILVVGPIK